jgi:uncharacterized protein
MRIRIDDIKENGLTRDLCEAPETFPALADLDDSAAIVDPLQIHLRAIRVSDFIEVEGSIKTRLRIACSRCLSEFETPLDVPFALTYTRNLPEIDTDAADEEGIEIDAESMGLIIFQGEEIDLREGIQEQVVMSLPLQPLCDTECRGLCPQCGIDLNKGKCNCNSNQPEFRNRFTALKDFKIEKKEDR